jgi:hypothetical protein
MKTKIVTAYWMDANGLPFLGSNSGRKERYLGSLIAYCQNIDLPIICYTHNKSLSELHNIKEKYNLNNLEIKLLELSDVKYHKEIQEIVNSDVDRYQRDLDGRGAEIMWGKFDVIERELDSCDKLFWLDVGLQHPGIFTWRYSKVFNKVEDHKDSIKLGSWWANLDVYNYKYFFNTEVITNLSNAIDNKITLITSYGPQISYPFYSLGLVNTHFETPYPVGALVGGDVVPMKKYVNLFWEFAKKVLDSKILCTEESIMKPILDMMDKNEVKPFTFTSFYCCEHDKFHFEEWEESWGEPKPFYTAWNDLINYSKNSI